MPETSPDLSAEPVEEIELDRAPRFDIGDKVRALRPVRNDGTFPGSRIGDVLVNAGEPGYVAGVGAFLQRHRIYAVDFFEIGRIVGMREFELESIEVTMKVTVARRGETLTVYVAKKDLEEAVVAQELPELWGGWIELANGWRLELPPMAADTRLPLTVEARKLAEAD